MGHRSAPLGDRIRTRKRQGGAQLGLALGHPPQLSPAEEQVERDSHVRHKDDDEQPGKGVCRSPFLAHEPRHEKERQDKAGYRNQVGHIGVREESPKEFANISVHEPFRRQESRLIRCKFGIAAQITLELPPARRKVSPSAFGRILKWPTRADCKSAGLRLPWFESRSYHHPSLDGLLLVMIGVYTKEWGGAVFGSTPKNGEGL